MDVFVIMLFKLNINFLIFVNLFINGFFLLIISIIDCWVLDNCVIINRCVKSDGYLFCFEVYC